MCATARILMSIIVWWYSRRWDWCSATLFHSYRSTCSHIIRKSASWMSHNRHPINHYRFLHKFQFLVIFKVLSIVKAIIVCCSFVYSALIFFLDFLLTFAHNVRFPSFPTFYTFIRLFFDFHQRYWKINSKYSLISFWLFLTMKIRMHHIGGASCFDIHANPQTISILTSMFILPNRSIIILCLLSPLPLENLWKIIIYAHIIHTRISYTRISCEWKRMDCVVHKKYNIYGRQHKIALVKIHSLFAYLLFWSVRHKIFGSLINEHGKMVFIFTSCSCFRLPSTAKHRH